MITSLLLNANDSKQYEDIDSVIKSVISLSYTGDIRMTLGLEKKDKFDRIYQGNKDNFLKIYAPVYQEMMFKHMQVIL
jgi:hypothetical protein